MATRQFIRSRREDIHGKIISKAVGILWNFEPPTKSVGTQTHGPRISFFIRHNWHYVEGSIDADDKDIESLVTNVQCDDKLSSTIREKEHEEPHLNLQNNATEWHETKPSIGIQKSETNSDELSAKDRHHPLPSFPPEVLARIVAILTYNSQICLSQTCQKFRYLSSITRQGLDTEIKSIQMKDYLPCFKCNRILPRSRFAEKQRSGKYLPGHTRAGDRFCLWCGIKLKIFKPGNLIRIWWYEFYFCGGCHLPVLGSRCSKCNKCAMCLGSNRRSPIKTPKCPSCKTRTMCRPKDRSNKNCLTERLHKLVFDVDEETTVGVLGCKNTCSLPIALHPMDFICLYRQIIFAPGYEYETYGGVPWVRMKNDITLQDAYKVAEYITAVDRKVDFILAPGLFGATGTLKVWRLTQML